MFRKAISHLIDWLNSKQRKPLILRGARQTGKTWLVRNLAEQTSKTLLELNFEKRPELLFLFQSNDVSQILLALETHFRQKFDIHRSILFLDEVQARPEIIAKLRWFAEDLPDLPVIAAGSLLDFVLRDPQFSMPVGRVSYYHLEPLSFFEFLTATGNQALVDFLKNSSISSLIPQSLHEDLCQKINEFCLIGGMPEAVNRWIQEKSILMVQQIHHDLLASYRNDFAKYPTRIAVERLNEVMLAIPNMLGNKFTLKQVSRHLNTSTVKNALELLCLAKVCHKVNAVSADGLPLGAGVKVNIFKIILLDVAFASTLLGLQPEFIQPLELKNNGAIAEQLAGQLLRCIFPYFQEPNLYYWQREDRHSAEIDYIIQHKNFMIPVEIKAGSTGSMRSLHQFMHLRHLDYAVRINYDLPSVTSVQVQLHDATPVEYTLLSIPFYLIEELPRLLDEMIRY